MAKPHICPVCSGQGKVQRAPHIPGDQMTYTTGGDSLYTCPACHGECVVWEQEPLNLQPVSPDLFSTLDNYNIVSLWRDSLGHYH